MVVGFSEEDYAGVLLPHTDSIVVTLQVANHRIHRMFIDNGSSVHILYWSAFRNMEMSLEKVIQATCPLVGFSKTIMIKFLLVDRPSAYNAILGRAALNDLKAVTSTSHLKIKFPTERGVGEVRGEQGVASQCYNLTMKETPSQGNCREKGEQ
jgi:hypothetical protein